MPRQRTHSQRGTGRRKGRFSRIYKLLSFLVVAAAIIVACVVFFRVNRVTVAGNSRYSGEEVIAASGIETGDNLVALHKGSIANRIIVNLPYVRGVTIDRVFPDGVLLTVEEHMAAASVSDGSSRWYISSGGKLLERSEEEGPLRITGLTAVEPAAGAAMSVSEEEAGRLNYVLELLKVLEEKGLLSDCPALDCSRAGTLELSYLNFTVKMPTTGDFSYMLHCMERALEEDDRVSRDDTGTFDFTISDGKFYFSRGTA